MLFNSIDFLIFFPIVFLFSFLLKGKAWVGFLMVASCFFYGYWKPAYLVLLMVSTGSCWFAALLLGKQISGVNRRIILSFCIALNMGLLFYFKYLNFTVNTSNLFFAMIGSNVSLPALRIVLPVGISFFTFQNVGYVIDVYFNKIKPENSLVTYTAFLTFFPQLVAGPIERATNLLPQFYAKEIVDYERIRSGLLLVLWGFLKKVVIADRLAVFVDLVYNNPQSSMSNQFILATYFFSFQIYFDFSGYSDIATGTARMLGFDLMKNFDCPYKADSIQNFWKRWHISLTTWFKDYVYIPLGGSRVSLLKYFRNIAVVFLLSGIWHGAKWTFVLWGMIHVVYFMIEK